MFFFFFVGWLVWCEHAVVLNRVIKTIVVNGLIRISIWKIQFFPWPWKIYKLHSYKVKNSCVLSKRQRRRKKLKNICYKCIVFIAKQQVISESFHYFRNVAWFSTLIYVVVICLFFFFSPSNLMISVAKKKSVISFFLFRFAMEAWRYSFFSCVVRRFQFHNS